MKRTAILASALALFAVGVPFGWGLRNWSQFARNPAPESLTPGISPPAPSPETASKALPRDEPVNRLRQIAAQSNSSKRARAVAIIAEGLDETQIRAVLAELANMHLPERDEIASLLIERWAKLNPMAAIDFAKGIKISRERNSALRAAVKGWAEVDLSAAKEWAVALQGPMKDGALRGLITAMVESDPKGACALVQKLDQEVDGELAEELFDQWTERDPSEAAAHVSQLPKGIFQDQAIQVVAERWASNDLTGALAWAETMWDQKLSRASGNRIPAGHDAISSVLQAWLRQNADAAIQWIEQQSDEKKRSGVLTALIALEGDRDPEQAAHLITDKLQPGDLQDKALKDLAYRWSFCDTKGALAWVEQLADPRLQQLLLPGIAFAFDFSPEGAQEAITLAEKVGGPHSETTIKRALGGWVGQDPAAAAAWVEKRAPNKDYYYGIAYSWVKKEPKGATEWVGNLPQSPAREAFLQDIAAMMKYNYIEPLVATQWVAGITDASKREEAYANIAKTWLPRDAEAARAWLHDAPINQKLKDELLKSDAK
jgi:hypothetical protein